MDFFTLLLLAIGLCFDSFAVSLSCGLQCSSCRSLYGLRFVVIMGFMQGIMPVLGWLLASNFSGPIKELDHWIAFVLLMILGGKMVYEAISESKNDRAKDATPCCVEDHSTEGKKTKKQVFGLKRSITLGIATSVDALAMGVVVAFLPWSIKDGASDLFNLVVLFLVVALVTMVASACGLFLGSRSSDKLGSKAELMGGIILMIIGLKILLEHLFL